jgi:hypothetical protein
VPAAITMAETVKAECDKAMSELTGGAVQAVTAVAALKDWMATQGVESTACQAGPSSIC